MRFHSRLRRLETARDDCPGRWPIPSVFHVRAGDVGPEVSEPVCQLCRRLAGEHRKPPLVNAIHIIDPPDALPVGPDGSAPR